ncbi:MAG TPA: phosphoglycolate phosphatase [Beijerinckiaceae bacterium]|jgi:phosphoglycolate phosphatase
MRSPLPPTVVFDLDGTLADTAPDLVATLNAILAREGLPGVAAGEAHDMIGAGAKALIQRGFALAGQELAPARLDALYDAFLAHYAEHLCEETALYPGVAAALDHLAAAGCLLAVCTNKVEAHAVSLIEALGLRDRFAAICGRDTFPMCKPDPRHILLTVERAGGDPHHAVMVGDSRSDIAAAQAAGLPVVAVPFGYSDVPVETLGPDVVIHHFDELADVVLALLAPERPRLAAIA